MGVRGINDKKQSINDNVSILDVSLEEINRNKLEHNQLDNTTTPQIIVRTVEKLRRTIDAMCYPRGGCIFSLSSSIQHYQSALNALEQKRNKIIKKLNNNINIES